MSLSLPYTSVTKSVQYGSVTITTGTSNTATITSVDTTKAVLITLGSSCDIDNATYTPRATLTNATTVTATRVGSGGQTTVTSFVVVEFY